MESNSLYNTFAKIYTNRVKLYNKKSKLEREIKEKLKEQILLKTILLQKEEIISNQKEEIISNQKEEIISNQKEEIISNQKEDLSKFNFSLSKGTETYFEVLELKTDPLYYKSRRLYTSYKDTSKMVYICEIKNNEMCITSDDGKLWKGGDVWKKFVDSFKQNLEFNTIDHFFGLSYKPVQTRLDVKNKK